jgi:hypothetical protein
MLFLSASLVLPVGCPPSSPDLMAEPRPVLADVPVPEGFSLDMGKSRSVSNASGTRFVNHCYKGNKNPISVVRFYEKQMPIYGWAEPNTILAGGRTTTDYVKGQENCRISIYGETWDTIVEVTIHPAGSSPAK